MKYDSSLPFTQLKLSMELQRLTSHSRRFTDDSGGGCANGWWKVHHLPFAILSNFSNPYKVIHVSFKIRPTFVLCDPTVTLHY